MFHDIIKLALSLFLVIVAPVADADEIHLRDGRIIRIKLFWEKNDKVMFERYGSIVGISTESVKEVRSNQASNKNNRYTKTWRDTRTGMEFVWIPSGCINTIDQKDGFEKEICLDGFWMGTFEVKNSQFRRFAPSHNQESFYLDSYLGENDQPAVNVSAEQAREFADWMTDLNKGNFKFIQRSQKTEIFNIFSEVLFYINSEISLKFIRFGILMIGTIFNRRFVCT